MINMSCVYVCLYIYLFIEYVSSKQHTPCKERYSAERVKQGRRRLHFEQNHLDTQSGQCWSETVSASHPLSHPPQPSSPRVEARCNKGFEALHVYRGNSQQCHIITKQCLVLLEQDFKNCSPFIATKPK